MALAATIVDDLRFDDLFLFGGRASPSKLYLKLVFKIILKIILSQILIDFEP